MSAMSDHYLARAADCAAEASTSTLANVRDRLLRSEQAWRAMAEQLLRTERLRNARTAGATDGLA